MLKGMPLQKSLALGSFMGEVCEPFNPRIFSNQFRHSKRKKKIQSFRVSIILIEKPDKLCNENNKQKLFVNIDVKVLN